MNFTYFININKTLNTLTYLGCADGVTDIGTENEICEQSSNSGISAVFPATQMPLVKTWICLFFSLVV